LIAHESGDHSPLPNYFSFFGLCHLSPLASQHEL
jgi:hypothetical protein